MANRTKFTLKKRGQFLETLRDVPNVTAAAHLIGMSRRALYNIREADEEFKKDWDDAVDEGVELIERELHRRAVEGVEKTFYKNGEKTGSVTEYSDVLLMFMLKAVRPDKYRERYDVTSDGEKLGAPTIEVILPAVQGQKPQQ